MSRLFLKTAASGDTIDQVMLVSNKQIAKTKDSKPYLKLMVADSTGSIPARMWNVPAHMANFVPDSGFVKLSGRIELYQGSPQLIIEGVGPALPGSFDPGDLVAQSNNDINEMFAQLKDILNTIKNRNVRALVAAYLADDKLMAQFRKAPAAVSYHHAFLGGLLEHTLSTLKLAKAILPLYPQVKADIALAGLFLHDLGKVWELRYDGAFEYSDDGQLVGHIVQGASWLEQKAIDATKTLGKEVPASVVRHLQHIILSHHGEAEYGAAKPPQTVEAWFVHLVDHLDAKLFMALNPPGMQPQAGQWSDMVRGLGGRVLNAELPE